MDGPKSSVSTLRRTLSSSNVEAAEQIHEFIKIQQNACKDQIPTLHRDVTKSSMILPEQYNSQTLQLCIDLETLHVLESTLALNWCINCRSLLPFHVGGDGNSLLHSLSLYMFGVHDKNLVLRQLLYQRLFMEATKGPIRNRWMVQNDVNSGVTWNKVVELASEREQSGPVKYSPLSSIHIFAMANILARPIIVCCSTDVRSSVGGIYLPLARRSTECEKSPIVLGYVSGHFVPLISSENLKIGLSKSAPSEDAHHCVPLVHSNYSNLSLKFLLPTEELGDKPGNLRNAYLDVINITNTEGEGRKIIDAAMLKFKTPPAFSIELMWSLEQLAINLVPGRSASGANQAPHGSIKNGNECFPPMHIPPIPTGSERQYSMPYNVEDNVYESLISCARKGCNNNASSNNNLSLCPDCWKLKETSAKKMIDPFTSPTVSSSVGTAIKCVNLPCGNDGLSRLMGKCTPCFMKELQKTDDVRSGNADISSDFKPLAFSDVHSDFQAITSSRTAVPKDNISQEYGMQHSIVGGSAVVNENSNECDYDKLSDVDFTQIRKNADHSNYDRLNNLTNTQNISVADDDGYMLPIPVVQTSPLDSSRKNLTAAGETSLSEATGSTPRRAMNGPSDSIRSKVLCDVAGCLNSIGVDGKHCKVHNPDNVKQNFKTCIMKGCNNSAEFNDNFLCMVCFQSQKHNNAPPDVTGNQAFDLRSMTRDLPPIPHPGAPYPTLSGNSTTMLPEIPTIPTIPNFREIPEIPGLPDRSSGVQSSRYPPILGIQGANYSTSNFTPPSAYGGFETFDRTVGSHDASLNWQRGAPGVVRSGEVTTANCLHCDQHANPAKGGLCNECSKQRSMGMIDSGSAKCINDDCEAKGSEMYNFLCELCYKKQLEAMNLQNKGNHQGISNTYMNTGTPQTVLSTKRDFNLQDMNNSGLAHHVHGTLMGYTIQQQQQQQQQQQDDLFPQQPSHHQYVNTGLQGFQGQQHQLHGNPLPPQTLDHFPQVEPTMIREEKRKCKGLNCDFFGSEEFGGHCSGCFLNITKKESEKQEGIRTYAPEAGGEENGDPSEQIRPRRCLRENCHNYGSRQRKGYCSECYKLVALT